MAGLEEGTVTYILLKQLLAVTILYGGLAINNLLFYNFCLPRLSVYAPLWRKHKFSSINEQTPKSISLQRTIYFIHISATFKKTGFNFLNDRLFQLGFHISCFSHDALYFDRLDFGMDVQSLLESSSI